MAEISRDRQILTATDVRIFGNELAKRANSIGHGQRFNMGVAIFLHNIEATAAFACCLRVLISFPYSQSAFCSCRTWTTFRKPPWGPNPNMYHSARTTINAPSFQNAATPPAQNRTLAAPPPRKSRIEMHMRVCGHGTPNDVLPQRKNKDQCEQPARWSQVFCASSTDTKLLTVALTSQAD